MGPSTTTNNKGPCERSVQPKLLPRNPSARHKPPINSHPTPRPQTLEAPPLPTAPPLPSPLEGKRRRRASFPTCRRLPHTPPSCRILILTLFSSLFSWRSQIRSGENPSP